MYSMNLSLQARGRCPVLQQYPWLIVSANRGSEWIRAIKIQQFSLPVATVSAVGTAQKPVPIWIWIHWGNTNMTHSHPQHCMQHKQHVAEIIHNHITWPEVNHSPHGQGHWLTLKGVFQRAMPVLVKAGSDTVTSSVQRWIYTLYDTVTCTIPILTFS